MASTVKGFPKKFPVRDDDRRPLRYRIASLAGRVYLCLFSRRRLRIEGEDNIPGDGPCWSPAITSAISTPSCSVGTSRAPCS